MSSFGLATGEGQRSIASRFLAKSISMYSFVVVKPTCSSQDLMTLVSIYWTESGGTRSLYKGDSTAALPPSIRSGVESVNVGRATVAA